MAKFGGIYSEQLRSIVERIERVEEEQAASAADKREIYAEAKGNGYDTKTIRQIIRLRKLSKSERDEEEALLDLYKGALGMLGDTPLGEAAIRRLEKDRPKPPEAPAPLVPLPKAGETKPAPEAEKKPPAPKPDPGPTIEQARAMGKKAGEDGESISKNPFPARDPRRAAWDEEWCKAAGSDGMEIPEAWRRTPKKKDDEKPEEPKED